MLLGVRAKSGELIVADCESTEVKCVSIVMRIPEEQRWDAKASSPAPYPQELNPWSSNISEHTSPHVTK